jgi:Na+/melibiose symporter-like transporter
MLPDTVEFGEWRTGVPSESLAFGLLVLGQKAALGLGAGFLGLNLARAGYIATRVAKQAGSDQECGAGSRDRFRDRVGH